MLPSNLSSTSEAPPTAPNPVLRHLLWLGFPSPVPAPPTPPAPPPFLSPFLLPAPLLTLSLVSQTTPALQNRASQLLVTAGAGRPFWIMAKGNHSKVRSVLRYLAPEQRAPGRTGAGNQQESKPLLYASSVLGAVRT